MRQKIFWFIFSLAVVFLSGCTQECGEQSVYSEQCHALLLQRQLLESLKHDGIQVVAVGEEVTLILPTERFFYTHSNHLNNTDAVLNRIIAFINTYPVVDVLVKGYTDNKGDYVRNLALSRGQAEAISAYLWRHGLKGRLISAEGYGCHHPYGFNHLEIFFRLPPPDNVFH